MEMCELSVIKYILFIFNLLFAISGIGLIVAGALVIADVGEFSHFMEGRIMAPPVVLIVAGIIVFAVAFLGCYGAMRESYTMLMAFAVCLLVILIIELAVGIAAAVFKSDFQGVLKDVLKQSMDRYNDNKSDKIAWNNVQTKLECCGIDGPTDWPQGQRPMTCCHTTREGAPPLQETHCNTAISGDPYLYSDGCFTKLKDKVNAGAKVLIGVGIGIAFVEVIGIILACWLATAIKRKQ